MDFKNVVFKCIKGVPIDSVSTRKLSEIGFPVDAFAISDMSNSVDLSSYILKTSDSPFSRIGEIEKIYIMSLIDSRSKEIAFESALAKLKLLNITAKELEATLQSSCVYGLEPSDAETLIEEFVFMIKELLPRQLSDIYYSFDIEPNPAYAIFFELASEKLEIPRYGDISKPNYGQFVSYTFDGVKQRFSSGETMLSIYESTCATKAIIKDAINDMPHSTYDSIELVLFSLSRQYSYQRTVAYQEDAADFVLYKNGEKILNIIFLSEDELNNIDDYNKYLSELYLDDYPLLVIDDYELYNDYPSSIIRKAIKEPEYIKKHAEERSECFKYEKALLSSDRNYKAIQTAKLCGCYSCGAVFTPKDITDWYFCDADEKYGYAYCPKCGEDTVITDGQGYEISESFMQELIDYIETHDRFDY